MKIISENEIKTPIKRGIHKERYSSSEDMVAWDSLIFCFVDTDSDKILKKEIIDTILFLFDQYAVLYKERAKCENRYVWKESFGIMSDYKRTITVHIVPESDCKQFAINLLEGISAIDTLEHYFEFFINEKTKEPYLTPNFPNLPPEEFEGYLARTSTYLKEYLEFVREQN